MKAVEPCPMCRRKDTTEFTFSILNNTVFENKECDNHYIQGKISCLHCGYSVTNKVSGDTEELRDYTEELCKEETIETWNLLYNCSKDFETIEYRENLEDNKIEFKQKEPL